MGRATTCVLTAMLVVVLVACGGSKKKGPSATITPSSGLHDGQVVQVVGKGFTPGKQYGITECADKGTATGAGDCNLRGIKVGTADSKGVVTVSFTVAKSFGSNNIVCSSSQPCLVSVANAGSANPTEVGSSRISFAP
jgi:hypothetical protein